MVRGVGRSVDGATLRQGQMVRGTLPVVPTRASLMPGNRLASPSAIPSRAVNNTRFYSKSPVPARTESFNQRAAQIRQMVQQHNPAAASNFGARQGANSTGRYGNAGGGASGGSGNANRPGYTNGRSTAPGGNYQPRYSSPQPGSNQGGWQGFSRQSQPAPRSGGWNAPAPRSQSSAPSLGRFSSSPGGQSYGGYGSRPSLNMRKPIVVERSTAPRSYGGGGGAYSAPSGGSSHSAPSSSNGGGGGSHGRR
jgi:hypothetical protein